MPTIYFNDKLRRNLNQALFTRAYDTQAVESGQYGFRNWISWGGGISPIYTEYGTIQLMKGSVPTDFSGLTSPTSRSSDILAAWSTGTGTWTYSNPVTNGDGIARIDSPYVTASSSGIASWFWWYNVDRFDRILIQLAGTVGTSGTDMVMGDTTIIAGANYRFLNLKFDIPTEYTY
jgi:hypothetical protein